MASGNIPVHGRIIRLTVIIKTGQRKFSWFADNTLFIMHIDNGKHRRDLLLNIDFCSFFLTRTKYQAVKNLVKVTVEEFSAGKNSKLAFSQ